MSPNYFSLCSDKPHPVRWLWPRRIPAGKLTLLIGHPGVGKSLLATYLAATVTGDKQWPDLPPFTDPPPLHYPHYGGAVIVSLEDSPADTIAPRLTAMRATPNMVAIVDGVRSACDPDTVMPFSLTAHLNLLSQAIRSIDWPRLVILDTLTSLLVAPAVDLSRYENTQNLTQTEALFELLNIARRRDVAIVAITHLCKQHTLASVLRARTSMPFIAAARSILWLTTDPLDPDLRVLVSVKNTLGPPTPPLAFKVAAGPTLRWLPTHRYATDFDESRHSRSTLIEAANWLRDTLTPGPVPVIQLLTEARAAGFSPETLRRAKHLLGAKAIKSALECGWEWTLSPTPRLDPFTPDNKDGQPCPKL